jgi:hypothetical protein
MPRLKTPARISKASQFSRPPLERMMRLHQKLIAGDFPNCRKLSDELEVSTKTIQRDIDFMRDRLGLVFGIFGPSVVWAYAVPTAGRTIERKVTVFAEGFEESQMTPGRGFPIGANRWTGDLSSPVGADADVTPSEGSRMVRLTHPPKRRLGYAWRIVDLAEHPATATAKSLRLEVAASFNTPGPARPSRYQIRLAAFSQEPSAVREIWNNEPVLFDTVLQHVGRNVLTKPSDTGWQTVNASMQIPPGTRSVVISLAAGETDSTTLPAEHFLDDVQARFVITQAPGE